MRKDSFDYFLSDERSKQLAASQQACLNKRSTDSTLLAFDDEPTDEESLNLIAYIVRLLLARQHCAFEELLDMVEKAHQSLKANKKDWSRVAFVPAGGPPAKNNRSIR